MIPHLPAGFGLHVQARFNDGADRVIDEELIDRLAAMSRRELVAYCDGELARYSAEGWGMEPLLDVMMIQERHLRAVVEGRSRQMTHHRNFWMSERDEDRLTKLSDRLELPAASVVRLAIRHLLASLELGQVTHLTVPSETTVDIRPESPAS